MKKTAYLFPLLLVIYEVATYLANDMYLPALPEMSKELGFTLKEAQMTFTAWFIGGLTLHFILGPLSDRFGRRPILLTGCFMFVMATMLSTVTQGINSFLLARFIQGSMLSTIVVAGYASIHETYDRRQAIKILALMGSITVIAPAFGPLLGSLVLLVADWRWIFGMLTVWLSLCTLFLYVWMPESNPPEKRKPIDLKQLTRDYLAVMVNTQFVSRIVIVCLFMCVFIAWLTTIPFLVVERFHYSPVVLGVVQALVFSCHILANWSVDYCITKLGLMRLIRLGLAVVMMSGITALVAAFAYPNDLSGLVIAMMIFSAGTGLIFAPINRLGIEASSAPMGVRMAMDTTLFSVFCVLGSVIASVFYNGTLNTMSYLMMSVALLACLIRTYCVKGDFDGVSR